MWHFESHFTNVHEFEDRKPLSIHDKSRLTCICLEALEMESHRVPFHLIPFWIHEIHRSSIDQMLSFRALVSHNMLHSRSKPYGDLLVCVHLYHIFINFTVYFFFVYFCTYWKPSIRWHWKYYFSSIFYARRNMEKEKIKLQINISF